MKMAKLFAFVPALLLAASLQAHTALEQATPADGAVMHQAPSALELGFTEEVQLLKLEMTDAAGKQVSTSFKASADAQKVFAIPLPALAPAAYKASWTVLGKDGHRVEGSIAFTVDPNATETAGNSESHEQHGDH